mmetsp:Transcript_58704/g.134652  ORF Transcript_58704/g.134652 Transcript_58704/m.134652 type:complete len:127 (-) Transcript_58704:150-530(-)
MLDATASAECLGPPTRRNTAPLPLAPPSRPPPRPHPPPAALSSAAMASMPPPASAVSVRWHSDHAPPQLRIWLPTTVLAADDGSAGQHSLADDAALVSSGRGRAIAAARHGRRCADESSAASDSSS